MEYVENSDEEYFGIGIQEQTAVVMNFRMINGVIRDSDKFFFDMVGDNYVFKFSLPVLFNSQNSKVCCSQ